jgi:hypothetical protein
VTAWLLNDGCGDGVWTRKSKSRRGVGVALFLLVATLFVSLGDGKDDFEMVSARSFKLSLTKELAEGLVSSPFLWRLAGSSANGSSWAFGYTTAEYDPDVRGSVTAVKVFDNSGEELGYSPLTGFEIPPGYQTTIGDLNGDGTDELIVLDVEGRIRAFSGTGKLLEGFPSEPSQTTLLKGVPIVGDINSDGRPRLILLSAAAPFWGSVCALAVHDPSGKMASGFPIQVDPPAATPLVLADLHGRGTDSAVLCREDGAICAYGLSDGVCNTLAGVDIQSTFKTALAAVDLDSDGTDEIVFVTGGDLVQCASLLGKTPPPGWPFELEGAAFMGLAVLGARGGGHILCTYDVPHQQFVLLSQEGKICGKTPVEDSEGKVLVHLSAKGPFEGGGSYFTAVFHDPGNAGNVDTVFETHASSEAKAEAKRYSHATRVESRKRGPLTQEDIDHIEDEVRDYKRSLLIDQLGQARAEKLLFGEMATEVWVIDSSGKPLGEGPIRLADFHPFLDDRGKRPSAPALVYDEFSSRFLLLVGVNGEGPVPGRVELYVLP